MPRHSTTRCPFSCFAAYFGRLDQLHYLAHRFPNTNHTAAMLDRVDQGMIILQSFQFTTPHA
jgi:hypothetical protein